MMSGLVNFQNLIKSNGGVGFDRLNKKIMQLSYLVVNFFMKRKRGFYELNSLNIRPGVVFLICQYLFFVRNCFFQYPVTLFHTE